MQQLTLLNCEPRNSSFVSRISHHHLPIYVITKNYRNHMSLMAAIAGSMDLLSTASILMPVSRSKQKRLFEAIAANLWALAVSLAFWPNTELDLSGDLCDLCKILANAARPPIDLLLLWLLLSWLLLRFGPANTKLYGPNRICSPQNQSGLNAAQ